MKKTHTTMLIGMVFLVINTFGQPGGKTAHTYLDIMVNMVSTNIHYGGSNKSLADYKKSAKGIQAGLSFQSGITPAFSLVSELYYIRKGGELKAHNPFSGDASKLRFNTIELPVLTRFHIGKFYVNAGPSLAYTISGSKKINDQSGKLSFNDTRDGFKRFDAGIQAGGGFELPVKQKRIALDIRYSHGLTNITHDGEMRNRALMISVHFSKPWKTNPLAKK